MPETLLEGLRRFREEYFPHHRRQYRQLVEEGQHPSTLFIGCSDSRVVPHMLTDSAPGELFIARNVGNFVPPYEPVYGYHGTSAAIEFAVLRLRISNIVVCGHSHCGAIRALYEPLPPTARHLAKWLELAQDARLPEPVDEQVLRRTEERSIALQLARLLSYPMVRERVEAGNLFLHGWHYIIEDGAVNALDLESGCFMPVGEPGSRPDTAAPAPWAVDYSWLEAIHG